MELRDKIAIDYMNNELDKESRLYAGNRALSDVNKERMNRISKESYQMADAMMKAKGE